MRLLMPPFRLSLALTMTLTCALALSAQKPAAHSSSILDPQAGTTESEPVTRAPAQNPTLPAGPQEIEMASGGLNQRPLRQNPSLLSRGSPENRRTGNPP